NNPNPAGGLTTLTADAGANDDIVTALAIGAAVTLNLKGGSGTNTLVGPNLDAVWNITAADAGNIAGLVASFIKFQNVTGAGGGDFLVYKTIVGPVTVNLAAGTASLVGGTVTNVESAIGSAGGGDTLIGGPPGGVLVGHNSGNTLTGGLGRSVLIGGF